MKIILGQVEQTNSRFEIEPTPPPSGGGPSSNYYLKQNSKQICNYNKCKH